MDAFADIDLDLIELDKLSQEYEQFSDDENVRALLITPAQQHWEARADVFSEIEIEALVKEAYVSEPAEVLGTGDVAVQDVELEALTTFLDAPPNFDPYEPEWLDNVADVIQAIDSDAADWLTAFIGGETASIDVEKTTTYSEDDDDEVISTGSRHDLGAGDLGLAGGFGSTTVASYDGDAVQDDPNGYPSDPDDEVIATGVLANADIATGFALANSIYGNNPIPISINNGDEVIATGQIVRNEFGIPEIELIGNPDIGILDPDLDDDDESCPQIALDMNNLLDFSGDGDSNDEAALIAGAIAAGLAIAGGPIGWTIYFTALALLATYADANPSLGVGSTGEGDGGCGSSA